VVYFGVLCICIDDYMHELYNLEFKISYIINPTNFLPVHFEACIYSFKL